MPRMTRRSNPTGLVEIPNGAVQISLTGTGQERVLSVTKLDLAKKNIPADAHVICIARTGRSSQRFDLGRVDSWSRSPQSLSEIDPSDSLSFRLLIRSADSPKLMASAERIRHRDPSQGESLIPIEVADLGQVAWRLEPGGEAGPVLLVNQAVYPSAAIAENDAQFVALVLPEALRQVCMEICDEPDGLTEEGDWRHEWEGWFKGLGATLPPPDPDHPDLKERWVDDVISRFCSKHMFCTLLARQRDSGDVK